MNMTEVTLLNRTVAGFTNSSPSDIQSAAWYLVLRDFDYADAEKAVITHFTGPNKHKFFEVGYILDGVKEINRLTPEKIEEDVRSAKTRGWIAEDWPRREPLPVDVSARLRTARETFQEQLAQMAAIGPEAAAGRIPIGDVGKRVPHAE